MTASTDTQRALGEVAQRLALPARTLKDIIDVLAADPGVERAMIYGSRAKGTSRRGSDIDLVVEGVKLNMRQLNRMAAAFDDLPMPYKMDLNILDHIEDRAVRDHIERVGVVIFER